MIQDNLSGTMFTLYEEKEQEYTLLAFWPYKVIWTDLLLSRAEKNLATSLNSQMGEYRDEAHCGVHTELVMWTCESHKAQLV